MRGETTQRAVLLDAMGTLLTFGDPVPRLRAGLRERLGVDVGEPAARAAIRAEIAYYRAHLHEGRDAASLAALRTACADAMRPALGAAAAGVPTPALVDALLGALRFTAYPDSVPALRALRAAGCRLVVVSNWDHSLHERLEERGWRRCSTAWSSRPSSARRSPTARCSRAGWRSRACARRTPGTWATTSPPTSRARWPPASAGADRHATVTQPRPPGVPASSAAWPSCRAWSALRRPTLGLPG